MSPMSYDLHFQPYLLGAALRPSSSRRPDQHLGPRSSGKWIDSSRVLDILRVDSSSSDSFLAAMN